MHESDFCKPQSETRYKPQSETRNPKQASRSAKAGDVGAAGAAVAKANEALAKYASSIEAETLNGRINTIKVPQTLSS